MQAESNKATVCALPSIHLPLTREASVIVLWHKWLYFKTMRMQGRLTLHVRRLVHIYLRLVAFFLKSQCQCSCTDTLTKILIPCRYENVLCSVGDIFHRVGFNNNQFFDNLKRASAFYRCPFFCLLSVESYVKPP